MSLESKGLNITLSSPYKVKTMSDAKPYNTPTFPVTLAQRV